MQKRLIEINEELTQIEARAAEIKGTVETAEHDDLEKLSGELTDMESRKADLIREKAEIEAKEKEARDFEAGKITATQITVKKEKTMEEIRNSAAYIEAYANYIKTGDDSECRALLTENVNGGTVAVPELVYSITKTAWEKEGIMALVRKTYMKGNLKVGFEISGDGAVVHTEGGNAISPESLVLGVVTLVPQSIKKVIQISDEVYDMRGEEFLRYIYDELTYRIAKKAADLIIAAIVAAGTVSTTTAVGVPVYNGSTVGQDTIANAMAQLSDEAANPVVMMNKATWGAFKTVQYAGNFNTDPFEGLPVLFNNTIKAYSAASTGDTYAIVGDLGHGAMANFPNGEEITFKFDDLTLKKQDLIEVMGREYVGLGIVAPNAFVKVTK